MLKDLKVLSEICEKVALNQFSGFLNRTDRLPPNKVETKSIIQPKHSVY